MKEAESLGFTVLAAPSLEVEMAPESEFVRLRESLIADSVAVFGSTTAADMCQKYFGEHLPELFEGHRVYAIGSRTADRLTELGIEVSELPKEYSSYGLVDLLKEDIGGKRVVMIRSDSGTDILSEGITEAGAELIDIAVYHLNDAGVTEDTEAMMDAIAEKRMDWIAFTSPMSSEVFFGHMSERFGEDGFRYMCQNVKVAAIGRPTAEALARLGRPVDLVPSKSTFRDMLEEIRNQIRQ